MVDAAVAAVEIGSEGETESESGAGAGCDVIGGAGGAGAGAGGGTGFSWGLRHDKIDIMQSGNKHTVQFEPKTFCLWQAY